MEMIYLQRVTTDIPWGFRLYGGSDYAQPLSVLKVNAGSIASGNLQAGDVILTIANQDTKDMSHAQALQEIKNAGNTMQLGISRNHNQPQQSEQLSSDVTSPTSYAPEPFSPETFTQQISLDDIINNDNNNNVDNNNNNDINNNNINNNNNNATSYNGYNNNDNNNTNNYNNYYNNSDDVTPPWNQQQQQPYQPYQPQQPQQYQQPQQQPQQQQRKMPDALLNLAVKGDSKKPFSYVPDISDIQAQREKVKRKGLPNQSIPKYQNLLSMPHFEDAPKHRGPPKLFNPPSQMDAPSNKGDAAVVANLQFNSPLNMYSSDNVIESLKGQTGAEVKDVVGLPQKDKSDVTLSPVYKMIHGIDQPKPKPAILYAEAKQQDPENANLEYPLKPTKYKGTGIPSRSFKMLQSMTSGENRMPSAALKQSLTDTEDDTGRHFPKQPTGNFHFRDMNEPTEQQQQEQQQQPKPRQQPQQQQQQPSSIPTYFNNPNDAYKYTPNYNYNQPNYSDIPNYGSPYSNVPQLYGAVRRGSVERREGSSEVDTSSIYQHLKGKGPGETNPKKVRYVGKSIPSKSFKFLQNMTGGPQDNDALPSAKKRQQPGHQSQSDVEYPDGASRPFKPQPQQHHHHFHGDGGRMPVNAMHQPPIEEPEATDF